MTQTLFTKVEPSEALIQGNCVQAAKQAVQAATE